MSTRESTATAHCQTCPAYQNAKLHRLGIDVSDFDYVIALAGNPNTGKSTLFNSMTGLRQHVGNWTGKTVARAEGAYSFNNANYKVVDLPGTYSLLSTSEDEEIARDFILFGQPSATVVVVDATRLERNLNLTLQILEITDKAVVALNLIDEAERHGIQIDVRALSKSLGVPVVPMVARKGIGLEDLLGNIEAVVKGEYVTRPHRVKQYDAKLEKAITELAAQIETRFPGLSNPRWVALRLLDGDPAIEEAVREGTLGQLAGQGAIQPNEVMVLQTA